MGGVKCTWSDRKLLQGKQMMRGITWICGEAPPSGDAETGRAVMSVQVQGPPGPAEPVWGLADGHPSKWSWHPGAGWDWLLPSRVRREREGKSQHSPSEAVAPSLVCQSIPELRENLCGGETTAKWPLLSPVQPAQRCPQTPSASQLQVGVCLLQGGSVSARPWEQSGSFSEELEKLWFQLWSRASCWCSTGGTWFKVSLGLSCSSGESGCSQPCSPFTAAEPHLQALHTATGSSFAVVGPFSSPLTLMSSWEISHLSRFYSAFHSCIFFVMHHLSVRDNNERSWNLNKCCMILQETISYD